VDLPIICTLSEEELRERRRAVLNSMRQAVVNVLSQLTRLVDLERRCCKFLTFRIVVEPGEAPIRLEVTGPPNAKTVIKEFFGLVSKTLLGSLDKKSTFVCCRGGL
jgi:hypothetical protein